jgi:hypothetical protein
MRKTLTTKYFSIDFTEQWSPHFQPKEYNWLEFDWVRIYTEFFRRFGTWEVEIYFLGFGLRIYGVYSCKANTLAFDALFKDITANKRLDIESSEFKVTTIINDKEYKVPLSVGNRLEELERLYKQLYSEKKKCQNRKKYTKKCCD